MRIEETILRHLVHKEHFARKALPFLRDEYFSDSSERLIYHRINEFVQKYNDIPSREALEIDLDQIKNLKDIYKSKKRIVSFSEKLNKFDIKKFLN